MNRRIFVAATIATAVGLAGGNVADAHHSIVECDRPGVWSISNSEPDKVETYTTDQGHSGTIPEWGTVYVNYSGTSLTVYGSWPNGVTHTAVGEGDCTDTTTTTEATTSTSTTTSSSTSSTSTEPSTSTSTTTSPGTTSTSPTTSSVPSSVPSTTQPPPSSTTSPPTSTSSEPPPSTSSEPPPSPPTPPPALPPTGLADTAWYFAAIAALCVTLGALTVRWNRSGR